MSDPDQDKFEALQGLVDAVCEGRISAEETGQLETLLRDDPEAQAFYLRRLRLHAALRWDQRNASQWNALKRLREMDPSGLSANAGQPADGQVSNPVASRPPSTAKRFLVWGPVVGLATCLAAAWFFLRGDLDRSMPPAEPLAKVVFSSDGQADFEPQDSQSPPKAVSLGDTLGRGKLNLKRGVLRLDFTSGASVTVEAPAALTLLSEARARLERGKLTALTPPEATGFTIDTASLKVVDLGTVFGVSADESGAAEVLVFEGKVELALADAPATDLPAESQLLEEGGAARALANASQIEPIDFDGQQFARSWPITYGVLSATGVVKFVEPAPFIVPAQYEDTEHLIVFPERESVHLMQDVEVTVTRPGSYEGPFENLKETLAGGRRVRTYLLQFNPVGRQGIPVQQMQGSVTFDRPILGLICTNKQLVATDGTLGAEKIERFPRGARGIEAGDSFVLSEDRRTLTVDFTAAPAIDQVRLVLDAPPLPPNMAP